MIRPETPADIPVVFEAAAVAENRDHYNNKVNHAGGEHAEASTGSHRHPE